MPETRLSDDLPGSSYLKVARVSSASKWRIQIQQSNLISQASAILLQRHPKSWSPLLLKTLKLSSNFTPSLFHQILSKIQTHPETCLSFFNWAKKTLDFKPDLKAQCELTRILIGSGRSKLGKPLLNSIVLDYPAAKIVPLLVQSPKAGDLENVLNSVIESYCSKDMYLQSLEAYKLSIGYGAGLTAASCNALLNLLANKNELRIAWCAFASMIRNGLVPDQCSWSVVARILYKDGKFERISRILETGIRTRMVFELMIEGYSKRGDFESAFRFLDEMRSRNIEPSFSAHSSVMDGACRYHDTKVIEKVMVESKGYLLVSDFDLIIQKLCSLGKTYAMEFFYKRACSEKIELNHATYGLMLKALVSDGGRVNDAIDLYYVLQEQSIFLVDKSCCDEFLIGLCKENPSLEVTKLLIEITRGGGLCSAAGKEISEYIRKLCAEGRWSKANELFDLILERGFLLDSLCYGSFVEHYCSNSQIDLAMCLHNKLEEVKVVLDSAMTYNVLLATLLEEKMIEEAMKVFDYMKTCKVLSSESFAVMIKGLCLEKELRKAMKLHDEMLEIGMKPDPKRYKRLISGFK